ncbi:MAG: diadenylate cyclase CdaA [Myxococcota bacterium]|nr:diadenylate cyclase CdaA [Myxococcota bacterium]MDW8362380.1 diadenylate cyclase CdaA [Myxococcales bacterium]
MLSGILETLGGFFARELRLVLLDVVDIGIVAAVVYRLLRLLHGTRAMQVVTGLVVVVLAYHVSRWLGLVTVWSILETVATYGVLLVVILFQSDIRRALARVGSRPLWPTARNARDVHVIEEVVRAAGQLAHRRIGALIVIERDAALDEFIEHGTEIDAAVRHELLYGLFVPSMDNPLHDGAVIVREGRIWQAGALLPLSSAPGLDRALGTRHRAAIGITEETDAVVVVVSEERGTITVCFQGNVVPALDTTTLSELLFGLLLPRRRRTKGPHADSSSRPSRVPTPATGSPVTRTDPSSETPPRRAAAPRPALTETQTSDAERRP